MKPFILEFIGGCWDGMNLCSESPDPVEVKLAKACYAETWSGTFGKITVVPSEYATQRGSQPGNRYVVTNRVDHDGEVLVRLELCCEEQMVDCPCHAKRIHLEFEGGHLDGLRLDSGSPNLEEALLATSYFCLTEHGKVDATLGDGLPLLPHMSTRQEIRPRSGDRYSVVGREEGKNQIAVRLRYQEGPHGQHEKT
jgi:hypothetical protein